MLDGLRGAEQIRGMNDVVAAMSGDDGADVARVRFFDELRELHTAAGAPSTRELEQRSRALATSSNKPAARLSHTTFHKALAGPAVPSWRTVQVLLAVLRVNAARMRFLWEAAKAEETRARKAARDGNLAVPAGPGNPGVQQRKQVEESNALQPSEFSTWQLDYDWRTAPPVIQLLAAAVRDTIDPRKLLFDIAPDDPSGTAPAVALVLDNDLRRAADVFGYVASISRNKGIELLVRTAALRPRLMSSLIPVLHDRFGYDAESLLVAAMYACDADDRSVEIAGWLIRKIYSGGRRDELVFTLVRSWVGDAPPQGREADATAPVPAWTAAVDGALMFRSTCQVIEALIRDPEHTRWGVNVLAWISKLHYGAAIAIFVNVIVHSDGEIRQATAASRRSVLAMLAHEFPQGTAMLLMRSLLESGGGLSPVDAGTLLCSLAHEDLTLACELSELMLVRSSESLELIVGNGDDLPVLAEIIMWLYGQRPAATARLLRGWLAKDPTPRDDLGPTLRRGRRVQPFGMLTVSMVYQNAEQAVACLSATVEGLGVYGIRRSQVNLLEGLDQGDNQLGERTRDRLREHAGPAWRELRQYL
jgi:hypothetical protein